MNPVAGPVCGTVVVGCVGGVCGVGSWEDWESSSSCVTLPVPGHVGGSVGLKLAQASPIGVLLPRGDLLGP